MKIKKQRKKFGRKLKNNGKNLDENLKTTEKIWMKIKKQRKKIV